MMFYHAGVDICIKRKANTKRLMICLPCRSRYMYKERNKYQEIDDVLPCRSRYMYKKMSKYQEIDDVYHAGVDICIKSRLHFLFVTNKH